MKAKQHEMAHNRRTIGLLLIALMPVYLAPALSMHICVSQGHHHGNCDGDVKSGSAKHPDNQPDHPFQFEKAEHQHCFELEKDKTPTLQPKGDFSFQQLALFIVVFNQSTDTYKENLNTAYHPPPNKEPPPDHYRIRPPPFTGV